jgi:hypothetical protein
MVHTKVRVRIGGTYWECWFVPHKGHGWWYPECPPELCLADFHAWFNEEVHGVKRPDVLGAPDGGAVLPVELPKCLKGLTALSEFLGSPIWDEGSQLGQRCLMLFVDNASVRVLVKVEQPPLKCSVAGRSVDDAFAGMDAALRSSTVVWEQDVPRPGPVAKKRR